MKGRFRTAGAMIALLSAVVPTDLTFAETANESVISSREISLTMMDELAGLAAGASNPGVLRTQLNALLQLSENARIYSIDGNPVNTPQDAVRMIMEGLARDAVPHLFIAGAAGLREIYLTPPREQGMDNNEE